MLASERRCNACIDPRWMLHFHVIRCTPYAPNRFAARKVRRCPSTLSQHRKWSPIYFPTIRIQLPVKNSWPPISMSVQTEDRRLMSRNKGGGGMQRELRVWFDYMHNMLMEINCQYNSISKSAVIVSNRSIRGVLMEAPIDQSIDRCRRDGVIVWKFRDNVSPQQMDLWRSLTTHSSDWSFP